MKSKIRCKTNISHKKVNFRDIAVEIKQGFFHTILYSKPSNAHLYLKAQSCHPPRTIHNTPKEQLICICGICSTIKDYIQHGQKMMTHFIKHRNNQQPLERVFLDVKNITGHILSEETPKKKRDPLTTIVCAWHPKFWYLSTVLRRNFKILQQDPGISEIFTSIPKNAFR